MSFLHAPSLASCMQYDKGYQQSWRPVYELSSAVVWLTAMNSAYALTFFSSLPPIGFLITASFCAAMMVIRLAQALPRWQQHQRLKGKRLALLKLTQKQCWALQQQNQESGVWLGWGFEWQRLHGQRAWDLLRSDNLWVFREHSATDSGNIRPPIPVVSGH